MTITGKKERPPQFVQRLAQNAKESFTRQQGAIWLMSKAHGLNLVPETILAQVIEGTGFIRTASIELYWADLSDTIIQAIVNHAHARGITATDSKVANTNEDTEQSDLPFLKE